MTCFCVITDKVNHNISLTVILAIVLIVMKCVSFILTTRHGCQKQYIEQRVGVFRNSCRGEMIKKMSRSDISSTFSFLYFCIFEMAALYTQFLWYLLQKCKGSVNLLCCTKRRVCSLNKYTAQYLSTINFHKVCELVY